MGFKALTVNTPADDAAHIFAEDDAAIFQGIFGRDGVLEVGSELEASIISNNRIRIGDGVLVVGGHIGRTAYADYQDIVVENGVANEKRNDLIVARFSTTGSGGIDTFVIDIKKGEPGGADPALVQEDVYSGGKIREVPLYRVRLAGLSVVGVDKMFELIPTAAGLQKKSESMNKVLAGIGNVSSAATKSLSVHAAGKLINFNQDNRPGDEIATFNSDGTIVINQDMTALINVLTCGSPLGSPRRQWVKLIDCTTKQTYAHSIEYGEYTTCTISKTLKLTKGTVLGVQVSEGVLLNDGAGPSYIEIVKLK